MRLSEAHALGQLDVNEFNERTAIASTAKTAGDLAPLLADLPGGQAVPKPAPRHTPSLSSYATVVGTDWHDGRDELRRRADEGDEDAQRRVAMAALSTWVLVAFITTAVWLATGFGGDHGGFWPIWPMIGLGIPLVAAMARWKFK
ncbi:uncharacterized protein DUF1707 [Antricoccus suffuscus]|uniref:Uncharacterized protein DUF1707 n=2 Tax=Antricoccus suffuscus TaxID=1629062 RepID=A0A2T0Z4W5_9ACTN|nr:uncharacterized protein DUF1707 [Antricoccus suffuscus]